MTDVKHPAKYTDCILDAIKLYIPRNGKVLDPFAGTGKLKNIVWNECLYLNEIEPEWARQGLPANVVVGDALKLPFANNSFEYIVTSPVYGSRMSDHHNAKDGSKRITYKHTIGRDLHPNNSGQLQWGNKYKDFHIQAWNECDRVLQNKGLMVLNVSNHIRKGQEVPVSEWHLEYFTEVLEYVLKKHIEIETPRMRRGENHQLRVSKENIYIMRKEK